MKRSNEMFSVSSIFLEALGIARGEIERGVMFSRCAV